MNTLKKLCVAAMLLSGIIRSNAALQTPVLDFTPPPELIRDSALADEWLQNLSAAETQSLESGKPVLAYFYKNDCSWCKKFNQQVLARPETGKLLKQFVPVRLNLDEVPSLAAQFFIEKVPCIIVILSDRNITDRLEGFADAAATEAFLKKALSPEAALKTMKPITEMLEKGNVPANKWPQIMLVAGSSYQNGRQIKKLALKLKPFPAKDLVDMLNHPQLAVRCGVLEILEECSGGDFGFDPWQRFDSPENTAAAAKWKKWAQSFANNEKIYVQLDKQRCAALINQVVSGKDEYIRKAVETLGNGGEIAVKEVKQYLTDNPDLPEVTRRRIKEIEYALVIPQSSNPKPAVLAHRLLFGNLDQRQKAVLAVGGCGSMVLPVLAECLNDEDPMIRETAVEAIAGLGIPESGKVIEQHLARESNKEVIFSIIRSLRNVKTRRSAMILISFLKSANEDHVIAALESLQELKSKESEEKIIACLADSRWRVQVAALDAVSKLRIKNAGPQLEKLLASKDEFVLRKTIEAMAAAEYKEAAKSLAKLYYQNDNVKGMIIRTYDSLNADIPPEFVTALKNKNDDVLLSIVQELEHCSARSLAVGIFLAGNSNQDVSVPAALFLTDYPDNSDALSALNKIMQSGRDAAIIKVMKKIHFDDDKKLTLFRKALAGMANPEPAKKDEKDNLNELADAFGAGQPDKKDAGSAKSKDLQQDLGDAFGFGSDAKKEGEKDPHIQFIDLLRNFFKSTNPDLKFYSGLVLCRIGDQSPIPYLKQVASTRDAEDMETVIQVAKRYPGNPDAIAILTAGMNSDKVDIRNRAASGAFDTKNRKIAQVVQGILDNPQSKMRIYDILNSISFRNMAQEHIQWAEKTLESATSSRDNKIFSMLILFGNWKSKYSPLIVKYVNSPDLWLRSNALLVLGEKDFNAFKEYIPVLAGAHEPLLRKTLPQVIQYLNLRDSYAERKILFDAEHSASFDPPNEYSYGRDKKLELDPAAIAALQKLAQDINPEVRSEAFFAMLVQDINFDFNDFARTLDAITDRTELSNRIYVFFDNNERKLKSEFQGLLAYLNSADKAKWERKMVEFRKDTALDAVESVQAQAVQTASAAVSANPSAAEKKQTEPAAASNEKRRIPLVYFYKNGCDDCRIISEILKTLPESFPTLDVIKYNIEKIDAMKLNEAYCEKFQVPEKIRMVAPSVFTANGCLIKDQINAGKLKRLISASAAAGDAWLILPQQQAQEIVKSEKRIEARYKTISCWLIASSGFFDGINPCAFATIIFFISYLAIAGRSKKQILQVGAAFTAGTFVAYYLMGMGLAELLNQIAVLKTIGKWVNLFMAVVVLLFAVLNIYDGILCLKGKLESMALQLPAFMKERIHWSIRTGTRSRRFIIAAFIAGMAVSVIELACTGQVYAPVIYYIIQTGINRTGAMLYLGLYNLAFVLPLIIIIILAYFGVRNEALSGLLKRNAALVKFSTALLFLILFLFLISVF